MCIFHTFFLEYFEIGQKPLTQKDYVSFENFTQT